MASDGKGNVYIGGSFKDVMYLDWLTKDTLRNTGGRTDWFLLKYGDMWPASVSNQSVSGNIKVYPNPATDRITIEGTTAGASVLITNMMGQQVYKAELSTAREQLDISTFIPGFYILQLTAEDGNKKVVKLQKL